MKEEKQWFNWNNNKHKLGSEQIHSLFELPQMFRAQLLRARALPAQLNRKLQPPIIKAISRDLQSDTND